MLQSICKGRRPLEKRSGKRKPQTLNLDVFSGCARDQSAQTRQFKPGCRDSAGPWVPAVWWCNAAFHGCRRVQEPGQKHHSVAGPRKPRSPNMTNNTHFARLFRNLVTTPKLLQSSYAQSYASTTTKPVRESPQTPFCSGGWARDQSAQQAARDLGCVLFGG